MHEEGTRRSHGWCRASRLSCSILYPLMFLLDEQQGKNLSPHDVDIQERGCDPASWWHRWWCRNSAVDPRIDGCVVGACSFVSFWKARFDYLDKILQMSVFFFCCFHSNCFSCDSSYVVEDAIAGRWYSMSSYFWDWVRLQSKLDSLDVSPSYESMGRREGALKKVFSFPGRRWTVNCHISVRCFSRNRRGFAISSKLFPPKQFE